MITIGTSAGTFGEFGLASFSLYLVSVKAELILSVAPAMSYIV